MFMKAGDSNSNYWPQHTHFLGKPLSAYVVNYQKIQNMINNNTAYQKLSTVYLTCGVNP